MVKHTQTIRQLLPTNFLSVFDHFVGLALKLLRFLFQVDFLYKDFNNNVFQGESEPVLTNL